MLAQGHVERAEVPARDIPLASEKRSKTAQAPTDTQAKNKPATPKKKRKQAEEKAKKRQEEQKMKNELAVAALLVQYIE